MGSRARHSQAAPLRPAGAARLCGASAPMLFDQVAAGLPAI
ncbi:hypothetical protein [Lysobacter gummosus]